MPAAERMPMLNEMGIRNADQRPDPDLARRRADHGHGARARQFLRRLRLHLGHRRERRRRPRHGAMDRRTASRSIDLWAFDIRRFGHASCSAQRYLHERAVESYHRYYLIHWPVEEMRIGPRRPPLAAATDAAPTRARCSARASAGSGRTGSRPTASSAADVPSFEGRPSWFAPVGARARGDPRARRADRPELVLEIRDRAAPAPSRPCSASPPTTSTSRPARSPTRSSATSAAASRPISRSCASPRTASTSSPAAASACATRHGSPHLPRDGSVAMNDVTSSRAVINLCGPARAQGAGEGRRRRRAATTAFPT